MPDTEHLTTGQVNAQETRQLEDILVAYQRITDRLGQIDDRLGSMSSRLSGDILREVANEGTDIPLAGLIGSFKINIGLAFQRLDSLDEWITNIEKVV